MAGSSHIQMRKAMIDPKHNSSCESYLNIGQRGAAVVTQTTHHVTGISIVIRVASEQ